MKSAESALRCTAMPRARRLGLVVTLSSALVLDHTPASLPGSSSRGGFRKCIRAVVYIGEWWPVSSKSLKCRRLQYKGFIAQKYPTQMFQSWDSRHFLFQKTNDHFQGWKSNFPQCDGQSDMRVKLSWCDPKLTLQIHVTTTGYKIPSSSLTFRDWLMHSWCHIRRQWLHMSRWNWYAVCIVDDWCKNWPYEMGLLL